MSIIVGSYEGIELLGISAGEVANPQEAIIKKRQIRFMENSNFLCWSNFCHCYHLSME